MNTYINNRYECDEIYDTLSYETEEELQNLLSDVMSDEYVRHIVSTEYV